LGKAKDWFENIPLGTITNWNFFQKLFTKRFEKRKDYQSLCNQIHNCKRKIGEYIMDFNDRFNNLVICFPQDLKPPQDSIIKIYISTMKDPYGGLIKEHPTTLFESQERACEIKENLSTSLIL
jgi:hypothetical protein